MSEAMEISERVGASGDSVRATKTTFEPHERLAEALREAEASCAAIAPLTQRAADLGIVTDEANAYSIQRINRDHRTRKGDRVIGRKIGLTAKSVQSQLGVDSPDFGYLWTRTYFGSGEQISRASLIQPKVEAEIALVIGRDINLADATAADLIRATEFALPALEIVDSRIADWKIGLFDTVADNASAACFVLGSDPVRLEKLRLAEVEMSLTRNGQTASEGSGADCLGHPMNAAVWLARKMAQMGDPLRAGDIVLTGALGRMVTADRGDVFQAKIGGLGQVSIAFS